MTTTNYEAEIRANRDHGYLDHYDVYVNGVLTASFSDSWDAEDWCDDRDLDFITTDPDRPAPVEFKMDEPVYVSLGEHESIAQMIVDAKAMSRDDLVEARKDACGDGMSLELCMVVKELTGKACDEEDIYMIATYALRIMGGDEGSEETNSEEGHEPSSTETEGENTMAFWFTPIDEKVHTFTTSSGDITVHWDTNNTQDWDQLMVELGELSEAQLNELLIAVSNSDLFEIDRKYLRGRISEEIINACIATEESNPYLYEWEDWDEVVERAEPPKVRQTNVNGIRYTLCEDGEDPYAIVNGHRYWSYDIWSFVVDGTEYSLFKEAADVLGIHPDDLAEIDRALYGI